MDRSQTYPSDVDHFRRWFPRYLENTTYAIRESLSNSASCWTTAQLEALRVLHKVGAVNPVLEKYRQKTLPPKLQCDLADFQDGSFRGPRHKLVLRNRMYHFYDALATVLERPAVVSGSLESVKTRADRKQANSHPEFVSGEGLGLSPPPDDHQNNRLDGYSSDSDSYRESQESMDSSAVQDRYKDEKATAAMANAFLSDVLSLWRAEKEPESPSSENPCLLEFTPVSARFEVSAVNFKFVAEDDGGLVLRRMDKSSKWSQEGPRYCSIECKARLLGEGLDMGMHVTNVIAQHAGEMIAQAHDLLLDAGVEFRKKDWDQDTVERMDCTGILLCFTQCMCMVKTATFSPKYLRKLFHQASAENSNARSPASYDPFSPPFIDDDSLLDEGSVKNMEEEEGGEVMEREEDKEDKEDEEEEEDEEEDEEETEDEEDGEEDEEDEDDFLEILSGKPHDLSSPGGRIEACREILSVVEYLRQRVIKMKDIQRGGFLPQVYLEMPLSLSTEGGSPSTSFLSSSCPSCSSSNNAPPCLNHVLYHKTTRVPIYLNPSCWSFTHIDILRVVLRSPSPLPSSSESSKVLDKPGSIPHLTLQRVLDPPELLPPFCYIPDLLTSTINSFQSTFRPFFRIFHDPHQLGFGFGLVTTNLTPLLYVEHTDRLLVSVPFLAYNDPDHRLSQRKLNPRSRRPKGLVDWSYNAAIGEEVGAGCVDPFDVSILLAMAQMQATVLTGEKVYKTYLLHPNTEGTQVRLLTAEISAHYLECLRNLSLPLSDQLVIYPSIVAISETGQEFLDLVRGILQGAPALPGIKKGTKRVKKVKVKKGAGENTTSSKKRREQKGGGEKPHPPKKKVARAKKPGTGD